MPTSINSADKAIKNDGECAVPTYLAYGVVRLQCGEWPIVRRQAERIRLTRTDRNPTRCEETRLMMGAGDPVAPHRRQWT